MSETLYFCSYTQMWRAAKNELGTLPIFFPSDRGVDAQPANTLLQFATKRSNRALRSIAGCGVKLVVTASIE
jgi:hypothetical protein